MEASPSTAWRWVQRAYARAVELGALPVGKHITTHTLRHSSARHWLASGIPINVVSRWLGHSESGSVMSSVEIRCYDSRGPSTQIGIIGQTPRNSNRKREET